MTLSFYCPFHRMIQTYEYYATTKQQSNYIRILYHQTLSLLSDPTF